jgi:hypothetical protein
MAEPAVRDFCGEALASAGDVPDDMARSGVDLQAKGDASLGTTGTQSSPKYISFGCYRMSDKGLFEKPKTDEQKGDGEQTGKVVLMEQRAKALACWFEP